MRALPFAAALLFASPAQAQGLDGLSWLNGCWRTEPRANGAVVTEVWASPPMPAMLGYSYTLRNGETRVWEQARIELIEGWPHFVAMPNGGTPVRFRMVEPGAPAVDIVQFENPEHDFPKLVQYRREGGRLIASIFGNDAESEITFDYGAIDCAAALAP
ncbi:MAG: DUF6265 family protein [Hyphomonadaceae bacterium]